MLVLVVTIILMAFAAYLAAGVVFLIPFQIKGLQKIDEGVHGSSVGLSIIIIPGCIVFWPILLQKWITVEKQGNESNVKRY